MTTNNVNVQQLAKEAVAEAQQNEAPAAPQYMTTEQVQYLLTNQQRAFERQISGLTSKIDTGLNAIRRDTQTWAEQQVQFQNQQQRKAWLDSLDESQRTVAERMLAEVDAIRQPTQKESETQPPAPADTTSMWEAVYQLVEDYGLKRDNPAIDYAAFTEDGLSDRQRQQRFMASLRKASVPSAAPQSTPAQRSQPPAPPANVPAGSGSGYRNVEDVRDAFITGKLNIDEYRQRMQALGEPV